MSEETVWMRVQLTDQEMRIAALIGAERQLQSAGSPGTKHGVPSLDPWTMHLNGVAAEIATAKSLGRYWPPSVGTFRNQPDIPPGPGRPTSVEVRWITRPDYDLKIRSDDHDDSIYVLVSGNAPNMILHGWFICRDARKPEFWTELGNGRPGLWCVPKTRLHGPQGRIPDGYTSTIV